MSESAATPATNTVATFKVSVLRCRKTGRVLFLEAGKDFVDTLFSFLVLPVGTIIHMLSTSGHAEVKAVGGISSIYESLEKLHCSFLHVDKNHLLQPKPPVAGTNYGSTGLLKGLELAKLVQRDPIKLPAFYYILCSRCRTLSTRENSRCETCRRTSTVRVSSKYICKIQKMTVLPKDLQSLEAEIERSVQDPVEAAPCSDGTSQAGFVRENITYMVTDNLKVMPSTSIRSIKVLNKLKVATLADLESSDISISISHILQLLQSALTSSSCLNDVFGIMK